MGRAVGRCMSNNNNHLSTLPDHALATVTGGKALIEGIRQSFNAGAIALSIMNPTQPPVPRIPNPPTIVRPAPQLPPITGK